jgi:hypothetical protein
MMRPSTLLFALTAIAAAAVPAVAIAQQTQSSPAATAQIDDEARAALSQVQVRGQARHHRLDSSEMRRVGGTYAMSNGWTMDVKPGARNVMVSINDGAPIELLAQTADRFASADGNIATVFNFGPWQEDVVMSYVPDGRLSSARVVLGSARLVAR